MTYFENKVCIITGGSTGIGFCLGQKLLEYGAAKVYFTARTQAKLDEAAEKLAEYGERARFISSDVTDPEAVKALIDTVVAENGRIDFLFNNAGIGSGGQTERASLRAWKRVLDANLWGVIHGVNAVLPIMIEQGFGHIVNTSSISGLVPAPFQTLYATGKFAIVGLSESLRLEMEARKTGVRVSVLCPGPVVSEIFQKGGRDVPDNAIPTDYAAEWALKRVADEQGIIPVAEAAEGWYDLWKKEGRLADELMDYGAQADK